MPFHDAKCVRLGNLVRSPASMSSRAAPGGPMPFRPVSVMAVALSSSLSSLSAAFLRWQVRSRSLTSSATARRRARPAASRGRTVASNFLACAAGRSFFASPAISPGQKLVQLGDHAGVVVAQRPAPVGQDPQHRELLITR
jgi:hypothetical protein